MNFNSPSDLPAHPSKSCKVLTGREAIARYKRYKHKPPQGTKRYLVTLSKQIGGRYSNAIFMLEKHCPDGAMLTEFEYENRADQKEGLPHVQLLGEITQMTLNAGMTAGSETQNPFSN